MAKRKVKGIYCSTCQGLVEVYKKGKKKQYICENCGPIAHNPLPLIALGARMVGGALARKAISKVQDNLSPQKKEVKEGHTVISKSPSLTNNIVMRELYGD